MSTLCKLLAASFLNAYAETQTSPNILFVLIDDLGWNDVSWHGGSDFETPYLDEIAKDALLLNNYYVQHFCTPTRHALMSGRYPMRDGMQQWVIRSSSGYGMPLEITTLPDELKAAGYSTHLLGKWHLGFFDPDYTPTYRGFDTFMGYYGDKEEYYMKNNSEWAVFQHKPVDESLQRISGFDFRDGTTAWVSEEYSTYLYRDETIRRMEDYVSDKDADPFFIMLAHQAPHTPYDAPEEAFDRFTYIDDDDRSELAAVISVLDETMGDIVKYLKSEESGYLWDDTLVIVSSDNGGSVTEGASNFPLRGGKKTLWEGGIRATGFITGGWLPDSRRGEEFNALMHVTDWLPTLVSIAGAEPIGSLDLDGYDQSSNFVNGEIDKYHPREEILHHVIMHEDSESDGTSSSCYSEFCGAIRWRNYKLVIGTDSTMKYSDDESTGCLNSWCENAVRDQESLSSHSVQCSVSGNYEYPDIDEHSSCLFSGEACLYDMDNDPCEWNDIRSSNMDIFEQLIKKLHDYNASQAYPMFRSYPENASLANPNQFGGFWSPWENIDSDSMELIEDEPEELPKMEGPEEPKEDKNMDHEPEQQKGYEPEHEQVPEHEQDPEHERQSERGYEPEHEQEHGQQHGRDRILDAEIVNAKKASYTMNSHMMLLVVSLFAIASLVQLYHCWKSKQNEYKRIGDCSVDELRISA